MEYVCACVYVYMCMVIYLYIYIHVYMCAWVCIYTYISTCVYMCMRVYIIYAYVCMLVCACIKKRECVKETCPLCQYTMYFREYSSKGLQLSVLLVMSVSVSGETLLHPHFNRFLFYWDSNLIVTLSNQFIFFFRLRNYPTFCALVSSYKVFRCSCTGPFPALFSLAHLSVEVTRN